MSDFKELPESSLDYKPHTFYRKGEGNYNRVELCCCMKCEAYKECERRKQLANILLDTVDRILDETDIKSIATISMYNIFNPECNVEKKTKGAEDD